MTNTLKMKNGRTLVLGEKKRDGNKRQVMIDSNAAKLTFKEGGARRFTDVNKASKWAKGHNFEVVANFL